jgi:hypothetical protein
LIGLRVVELAKGLSMLIGLHCAREHWFSPAGLASNYRSYLQSTVYFGAG